jgi:hypothetical protein
VANANATALPHLPPGLGEAYRIAARRNFAITESLRTILFTALTSA